MKQKGKLIAALLLFTLLTMACSQYVCPAYTIEDNTEQQENVNG